MNTNPFYHEAIRNLYTDVSRTNDTHGALDSKGNKIVLDNAKLAVEMNHLCTMMHFSLCLPILAGTDGSLVSRRCRCLQS